MGILNKLFGNKSIVRQPVGSNVGMPVYSPAPPYENFYTRGSTPNTAFRSSYEPDAMRLHAPPTNLRGSDYRSLVDEGNALIERTPAADLQQYFREVTPLERTPVLVPAHGVVVPAPEWKRGWTQAYVPDQFLTNSMVTQAAPPPMLNRPIISNTVQSISGYRGPTKKVRAPKPNHGGQ